MCILLLESPSPESSLEPSPEPSPEPSTEPSPFPEPLPSFSKFQIDAVSLMVLPIYVSGKSLICSS